MIISMSLFWGNLAVGMGCMFGIFRDATEGRKSLRTLYDGSFALRGVEVGGGFEGLFIVLPQ